MPKILITKRGPRKKETQEKRGPGKKGDSGKKGTREKRGLRKKGDPAKKGTQEKGDPGKKGTQEKRGPGQKRENQEKRRPKLFYTNSTRLADLIVWVTCALELRLLECYLHFDKQKVAKRDSWLAGYLVIQYFWLTFAPDNI